MAYTLQVTLLAFNSQFEFPKDRKSIASTISMLVSANKKIFSKNQALLWLSRGENLPKTIS